MSLSQPSLVLQLNDVLAAYGYIELLEGSLARALDVIEVYRSKARSIVGKPV